MRNITKKAAEAFKAGKPFRLGNTEVDIDEGRVLLILYGNVIARRPDLLRWTKFEITTAGWNTATTRERLNGLFYVKVYQKAGQLYLNGKTWDGSWIVV